MQLRQLGQTDLFVSPLGLGTVKFGRNTAVKYPQPFQLPEDRTLLNCLSHSHALGINLLDTAPAYGNSETRLGHLLRGQRHKWLICSKAGEEFDGQQSSYHFQAEVITASVKRSLARLQTDYLDIVLIHSDGNDVDIIERYAVFDTLAHLKRQGLLRAYGMSTKTVKGGLLTVQHADVVMVTYNLMHTDELAVISAAAKQHTGVFIKKAFVSGHLQQLAQTNHDPVYASLAHCLQATGVSSIIIGSINPAHITANVNAVNSILQKTVTDQC